MTKTSYKKASTYQPGFYMLSVVSIKQNASTQVLVDSQLFTDNKTHCVHASSMFGSL